MGGEIPYPKLAYAATAAFLIAAASFTINDLCDQELDEMTGRKNPITKGRISPDFAAALALSRLRRCLHIVPCRFIAYSLLGWIQRLYGLLLLCIPQTNPRDLWSSCYKLFNRHNLHLRLVHFQLLVSYDICGSVLYVCHFTYREFLRELVKVIVDREGDSEWGIRTLAVKKGPKFAALVALVVMVGAVALSYLPVMFALYRSSYLFIVTLANVLLIITVALVYMQPTSEMASEAKKDMLITMGLGLIAFLVGPHFEYYSLSALPFEVLALGLFGFLLARIISHKTHWPLFLQQQKS